MKTRNNDKMTVPHHVDDDDLVSYLDGELARETQIEVRTHLEICWDCRRRLSVYQRSIENFLQVRQDKLLPPDLPPSGPAIELFRERLAEHRASVGAHSYFKVKMPDCRAFFRNITRPLNFEKFAPGTSRLMRVAAALILVSLVGGLIFLSNKYTTVSANELLRRSISTQTEQVNSTIQPVVHQRLQVHRKSVKSSAEDATNARLKQAAFVREGNESTLHGNNSITTRIPGSLNSSMPVSLTDLEKVFQINHMNAQRPLSAVSYQSWSESIKSKTEEVIRLTQADGLEVLTLKTIPTNPVSVGEITEARFTVREIDWHPTKLYLRVKADEGEYEYELIENDFEVVSLITLDPAIFTDESKKEIVSLPATTKLISPRPSPSASPDATLSQLTETKTPSVSTAKLPVATTSEAEVEVLDLLHKIGADISEQLNVARTADGRLMVEGIVETDKRKSEILQVLEPVAKNPAVKINIQTIDEVARVLAQQKQKAVGQGSVSTVEVNKGSLPVDAELRSYFSKNGANADEQIRKYASRMINHSQSALFQASAMNRLAGRFTTEQLRTLEPEARAKWLNIIRGYASVVKRETASLRQELDPIFFSGMPSGGEENEAPITNDADLIRATKRLYEIAAVNDRIVRSAFTLSTGNISTSAVKTSQFRRSLGNAEKLAAVVEKVR
jgi:hypothetical protein